MTKSMKAGPDKRVCFFTAVYKIKNSYLWRKGYHLILAYY